MKTMFTLTLSLLSFAVLAQSYSIGYKNTSFYDEDRDRNVTAYVYYPSNSEGQDAIPLQGGFPYIVFGHGFMMNQGDYDYLWEALVPKGYILINLTTETGTGPNHERFGRDLAFIADNFFTFSENGSDFFYNTAIDKCVVMGHSMGGGATHLASSYTQNMEAVITFAAAETNPSAIEAVAGANVETLVFYGEGDAVTPPEENQIPIYNSSSSDCKALIGVLGGIHCYFAESQWACDFGETVSGSDASISRDEQHDIVTDLVGLYLDGKLKSDMQALQQFRDSLSLSPRIQAETNCSFTGMNNYKPSRIMIFPNPANERVFFENLPVGNVSVKIYNLVGKCLVNIENPDSLYIGNLKPSIYIIKVFIDSELISTDRLIVSG